MPIYSKVDDWGGNSISKLLYTYLEDTLPEGKTILELGSGWGTSKLMEKWNVWSVEDKYEWHCKYNKTQSRLIPLEDGWYDPVILSHVIEAVGGYDLLLVDGPYNNREGFLDNLHLFSSTAPILFDDVRREEGQTIISLASAVLRRPYTIHGEGRTMFGVIA